jgi:hypothetical protein
LHFPLFLSIVIVYQFQLGVLPPEWQLAISPLALTLVEQQVLEFLCKFVSFGTVQTFIVLGLILISFTILSINTRRHITSVVGLYFFAFFFMIYFLARLAPAVFTGLVPQVWISVILGCINIALFCGLPALLIAKIKKIVGIRRKNNSIIAMEFKTCTACGQAFASNPVFCSRCLEKLEP